MKENNSMLLEARDNIIIPSVTSKILRLLDSLKRSEGGASIYNYIEQVIRETETTCHQVEHAYANVLTLLLDTLAKQLPDGSPLQVQLKLLELRLLPPLAPADLRNLQDFMTLHSDTFAHGAEEAGDIIEHALSPLLSSFKIREAAARPAGVETPVKEAPTNEAPPEKETPAPAVPEAPTRQDHEPERRVDLSYRRHLDEKRQGIQRIQHALAQQVTASIKLSQDFGNLLDRQHQSLQQANSQQDLEAAKQRLIQDTERLLEGHRMLSTKLDETHNYLRVIEADSQQLSDELTRIHLLSLTDDLTGLPNRRAFMRRLQDEVGRVQRYGNPLSLALIDLDGFKAVNDKFGHAAGDEVLRVFSGEILSIFRHHDLVARYGGEEFAVLLPNTHIEGALRALRKVQKRAEETSFQQGGSTLPLPSFSAGLSLYRPGETPENFIQRADHAMYRAKRLGRNRIESDQADSATPSSIS
ncbi:MAG: diguanylate cyclase [Gammaproteobacteria bacterium]|jgi:diguanylate cyclase